MSNLFVMFKPNPNYFQAATGQEYKPGQAPAVPAAPTDSSALYGQIEKQGELVRELKGKDAKSPATKEAIEKLLALKKEYKVHFISLFLSTFLQYFLR